MPINSPKVNFSVGGNTAGASTLVNSGTLTLAGGNNITLSQNGNAITISGPTTVAQSAQPVAASGANGSFSFSTLVFSNSNNVSFSTVAGSGIVASASFSQSVQTQNLQHVTLSGNTLGAMAAISSGTMTLAGGNNITLSQNGNAVTIVGGAGGGGGVNVAASNTTYTSGTVVFSGVNLTVSTNGQTVSLVAAGRAFNFFM